MDKFKAILFDFDGTLADTIPLILQAAADLAAKYGYGDIPDIATVRGKPLRELLSTLAIPKRKWPFYYFEIRRLVHQRMHTAQLFPGMKALLQKLKQQYFVGIITSTDELNVRQLLDPKIVDTVIGGASLFGKQQQIRRVVRQQQLEKEEVLYIGDEVRDIKASRKAGVHVAAVTWGANSAALLKSAEPDYLINTPKELSSLLL